jgi:glycosyltransferase involved in cell wall biosynthesis
MASKGEISVVQLGPYPPPHGGVQSNLIAIERHLRSHGLRCAAVNLTRHRRADTDTVFYPRSASELVRLLWRLPHRIVHLHLGGNLTPRLLGLALCCTLLPGRKSVVSFHSGGYPDSPAGRTARRATLRGWIFRRFDCVIAVNSAIASMFRRFGVAPERLRTIAPHAVDASQEAPLPEEMDSFFQRHDPVLITVGLLEPEYDLPMQIDVVERVRRRWPEAGLVIVGSGSLEAELQERIASRSWRDHVLLAGDVPHGATLAAIRRARLMLRTTLYDGDAVSVREALAFGVPVIGTDNGMRPAGVTLIPVRDSGALESAILREIEKERRPSHAGEGEAENLEQILAAYRDLVSRP